MPIKRVHVIVRGRVQGVFFRSYTHKEAMRLGLTGWVRNCQDGSVESVVEGELEQVEQMLSWFNTGSPLAKVTDVAIEEEESSGEFRSFEIHHY